METGGGPPEVAVPKRTIGSTMKSIFSEGQRNACPSDIDALVQLEEDSWAAAMRHTREQILRRVTENPESVFVYESPSQQVLGAIYTQRICDIEAVDEIPWRRNSFKEPERNVDVQNGKILQLLRVNTVQAGSAKGATGIGSQLRDLALRYAASLEIKQVCALTRASAYPGDGGVSYEEYVHRIDEAGLHQSDPGLNFHLLRGAKLKRIAPGWRPEDPANEGNGILIVYDLEELGVSPVTIEGIREQVASIVSDILDLDVATIDATIPLSDLGLDSLAMTSLNHAVRESFGVDLGPAGAYNFPTILALSAHIFSSSGNRDQITRALSSGNRSQLAIIGMSCRLPGGIEGPKKLWETTSTGRSVVGEVPGDRWDVDALVETEKALSDAAKQRLRWGGFIEDLNLFDANFFRISNAEANHMDPQQRLVLEYAYAAFYDAGYTKSSLEGMNAGVFLAIFGTDAVEVAATSDTSTSLYSVLGGSHSVAAGRVSFALGLTGPCCSYDTACSSSLVAIHAAMRSLQYGECDVAVVVGVNVMLTPTASKAMAVAGATSPTGRCHTFDASADGYVRSEGCGAVVLKRVEDARKDQNRAYAVIRGAAVAQDGLSATLMAPRGVAQQKLLRSALHDAGLNGKDVDYLEAHGTGTNLGDPIEMEAVAAVFGEGRASEHPLVIGSVKANVGHLEGAAGMAGLIQAVLVLQNETAVPNAELRTLNPKVGEVVTGVPLCFPTVSQNLRVSSGKAVDEALVAGVSSFGFSGTIANVLLGQAPLDIVRDVTAANEWNLPAGGILFLFTGQGSQYENMGRQLYEEEPIFRQALDQCENVYAKHTGESLLDVMHPEINRERRSGVLHLTKYTQPSLFALEWAVAKLWQSRGVYPSLVVGHSIGEIVAACVAGCMSMEDGLALVIERGRLMQALPQHRGVMFAARLNAEATNNAIAELGLESSLSIASVNGPKSVVLSGTEESVQAVLKRLDSKGKQLEVSHAFHSPLMQPMEDEFRSVVKSATLQANRIPLVSTVTGAVATGSDVSGIDHWVHQLTRPVLFMNAMEIALNSDAFEISTVLEIGPDPVLSAMARPWLKPRKPVEWLSSLERPRFSERPRKDLAGGIQLIDRLFDRKVFPPLVGVPHPLIQQRAMCGDQIVSETILHAGLMRIFRSENTHKGVFVYPASLCFCVEIALATELETQHGRSATVELRGVRVYSRLELQLGASLSCHSRSNGGVRSFEFYPSGQNQMACTISEALYHFNSKPYLAKALTEYKGMCPEKLAVSTSVPRFQRVMEAFQGENKILARMTLLKPGHSRSYFLHPLVLDGAFQLASLVRTGEWELTSLERLVYHQQTPSKRMDASGEFWAACDFLSRGENEMVLNLNLYDGEGAVLSEVKNCHLVREGKLDRVEIAEGLSTIQISTRVETIPEEAVEEQRVQISTSAMAMLIDVVRDAVETVGLTDDEVMEADLFDAGLDSLASVELLDSLNKALPTGLPLLNMSVLFHHHTLRGMMETLQPPDKVASTTGSQIQDDGLPTDSDSCDSAKEFPDTSSTVMSPMVQLQAGNRTAGGTLFLLPGACFSSRCFLDLCSLIGADIAVCGFEDLTLYNLRKPWESIEEIATEFIISMKEKQPDGPYKVGGWSMGGVVAYEVMRQLLKQGDRLDSLFLMDASVPAYQGIPVESDLDTASSIFVAHSLGYTVPDVAFLEDEESFISWSQSDRVDYILLRAQQLGVIKYSPSAKAQILYSIGQFKNLIMLAQQYDFPGLRESEFSKEQYPRIVSMRASMNIEDNMIFRDMFSNGLRVVTGQTDDYDEFFEMHEVRTHHWGLPSHKNVASIIATHLSTYYQWPVHVEEEVPEEPKRETSPSHNVLGLNDFENWKLTASTDVVVVGGGTIGMMFAIFLKTMFAPKANVIILEKSTKWEHVIGEGMLAASSKALSHALGRETMRILMGIKDGLAFWKIDESCEKLDDGFAFFASGVEETFQVERHTLNLAMAERCRRLGMQVMRGARVDVEESDLESPRKRIHAKVASGGELNLDCRVVVDSSGYASLISRHFGLFQTNFSDFDYNAYYGYFRMKDMPNIFNFSASMGRNVIFEEGFMWLFQVISWASNTESEMQSLIERLADIQESGGVYPSRSKAAGNLKWAPIFSIGITVRKDLDSSYGDPMERFMHFVNKYPAMQEILSHFEYLPDLYKNVGTKGHTGFTQYSSIVKRSKQVAGDGWLVIGDAAGHVNPFLGLGVNYGCGEAFHAAHDVSCALAMDSPVTRRTLNGFESYSNGIYSALTAEMELFYRSFQCREVFERVMAYKFGWLVFDLLSRNDYDYVAGDAQTFEVLNPAFLDTINTALRLLRAQKSSEEITQLHLTVDVLSNQGPNRDRHFSPAFIKEMTETINAKIEDNMQVLHLAQLRLSRFLDYYDDDLRRTSKARKGNAAESASSLSLATSAQRFTLRRCIKKSCNAVNGASNEHCSTCGTPLPAVDMKLHDWTHTYKTEKPDFLVHGMKLLEEYSKNGRKSYPPLSSPTRGRDVPYPIPSSLPASRIVMRSSFLKTSAQSSAVLSSDASRVSRRNSIVTEGRRQRKSSVVIREFSMLTPAELDDEDSQRSEILVLVGTQTHTSPGYASVLRKHILEDLSTRNPAACSIVFLNEYDAENLVNESRKIIFVTSTYGAGAPPDNAIELYRFLSIAEAECKSGEKLLDSLYYAVMALGDSSYDQFCGFGVFLDRILAKLGGHRIIQRGMLDAGTIGQDIFHSWTAEVCQKLRTPTSLLVEAGEPPARTKARSIRDKTDMCSWQVVNRTVLIGEQSPDDDEDETSAVHLEFELVAPEGRSLEANLAYCSGDHLGVRPWNDASAVASVAAFFNSPLGRTLQLSFGENLVEMTVKECLTTIVDLTAVARQTFWTALQLKVCTSDTLMQERLQKLVDLRELLEALESDEAETWRKILEDDDEDSFDCDDFDRIREVDEMLLGRILACPSSEVCKILLLPLAESIQSPLLEGLPLTIEKFVDLAPRLATRLYSLTAPLRTGTITDGLSVDSVAANSRIAVCVAGLAFVEPTTGRKVRGHCSTLMTGLSVGDRLELGIKPNPKFRLPADPNIPIIMIATGTGLSPFRGFMADRRRTLSTKTTSGGEWHLFFGCKSENEVLYKDDLVLYEREGILSSINFSFSRQENGPKCYVQDDLQRHSGLVYAVLREQNGVIMVCGRTEMVSTVRKVLAEILLKHGEMTQSEAIEEIQQLQTSRRVLLDNWS